LLRKTASPTERQLIDRDGHLVEFSLVTGAGNKTRETHATMMQEDLRKIALSSTSSLSTSFPDERITRTFDTSLLLGLTNMTLGRTRR